MMEADLGYSQGQGFRRHLACPCPALARCPPLPTPAGPALPTGLSWEQRPFDACPACPRSCQQLRVEPSYQPAPSVPKGPSNPAPPPANPPILERIRVPDK